MFVEAKRNWKPFCFYWLHLLYTLFDDITVFSTPYSQMLEVGGRGPMFGHLLNVRFVCVIFILVDCLVLCPSTVLTGPVAVKK